MMILLFHIKNRCINFVGEKQEESQEKKQKDKVDLRKVAKKGSLSPRALDRYKMISIGASE
tara:strand:- start:1913 stop:2095 length:183 start_codon:yes stop_codon:yes gene_type:complete